MQSTAGGTDANENGDTDEQEEKEKGRGEGRGREFNAKTVWRRLTDVTRRHH